MPQDTLGKKILEVEIPALSARCVNSSSSSTSLRFIIFFFLHFSSKFGYLPIPACLAALSII